MSEQNTLGEIAYKAFMRSDSGNTVLQSFESAAEAVAAASEKRYWQPIATAPRCCETVDVWNGERVPNAEYRPSIGKWCQLSFESEEARTWVPLDPQPTHWAPIPAAPEVANGKS